MADRQRLIIFDCDGVLVDSEPISIAVLVDAIRAAGGEIDVDLAYQSFLGRSFATMIDVLKADYGVEADEAFLDGLRQDLYGRFQRELRPISGIAEALDHLSDGVCVASSSQPERIRLSLALTGLGERFGTNIFSATMVRNGKPAPDLFLHAAREMGYDPAQCLVIEDSPAGIQAARSAGMSVFAFTGGSHAASAGLRDKVECLNPDLVFDDMASLPALLAAATP